jgi:phage N-6-adenine-methyltransferase
MGEDGFPSGTSGTGAYMPQAKTVEWETPKGLYELLDAEFSFSLDPCSTIGNHKCRRYYTKEEDGLWMPWAPHSVFMNPPYGREQGEWVKKAYEESLKGATVVCLLKAATDTKWWHEYVMRAKEVRFIKGRVHFQYQGVDLGPAPFPSCIVVFQSHYGTTLISSWRQAEDPPNGRKISVGDDHGMW